MSNLFRVCLRVTRLHVPYSGYFCKQNVQVMSDIQDRMRNVLREELLDWAFDDDDDDVLNEVFVTSK